MAVPARHIERASAVGHGLDQAFEARHRRQPPFASGAASTARASFVSQSRPAGPHWMRPLTIMAVTVVPVMPACSQSVSLATRTPGHARGCSALGPRLPWASPVACSCRRQSTSRVRGRCLAGRCSRSHLAAPGLGPYALMPIVMTDPAKNPRLGSMVLNLAAIWETDPKATQFVQFSSAANPIRGVPRGRWRKSLPTTTGSALATSRGSRWARSHPPRPRVGAQEDRASAGRSTCLAPHQVHSPAAVRRPQEHRRTAPL